MSMASDTVATIVVRMSTNAAHSGDHVLNDCLLDWTVAELKHRISLSHPLRPDVHDQRLIFGGRVLTDSACLRTVLLHGCHGNAAHHDTSAIYTVHLACNVSASVSSSVGEATSLRHRTGPHTLSSVRQEPVGVTSSAAGPATVQRCTMSREVYLHYWTQYIQHLQSAAAMEGGDLSWMHVPNHPPPTHEHPAPSPAHNNNNNVQNNNNNNMEAGNVVDNEQGHDWLEHVHVAVRLALVLFSLLVYSSGGRVMLVAAGALLLYLFNNGWFRRAFVNRPQQQQQQQQQQPPREAAGFTDVAAAVQPDHPVNMADNPRPATPQPGVNGGVMDEGGVEVQRRETGVLSLACSIAAAFFTSLLPDPPAADDF